ncbi:MAG: LPS export ABC transporter ATP-binding protein [Halanaerobiaceae bacterium]|jgi:lipopolysaccharide export system ATP-binding protein|nr:LPS export ABC transporter ATP-binding protein [Halanaerobiaceae bacterium]
MTIRAAGLVKEYSGIRVVDKVSLEVEKGEIVGLLGPNGAGKTTTFYMIVGLIKANSGRIYLADEEITNLAVFQRARKGIGYLSQEASVFRKMTVLNNLLAILQAQKLSKREALEKAEELMAEFDITHLKDRKGYQLSGGERRRVEIARSLTTDPSFILLDEPFAGIDPIAVNDIQNIITYLKKRGLGVLITDHSVRETLSITDRAYIMHRGKILLSGTSEEIANSDLARQLYLGDRFRM